MTQGQFLTCEKVYDTWSTSSNQDLTPLILMGVSKWRIASVIFFCRFNTVGSDKKPSKFNFHFGEMELIRVKHNTLISTVADVVDCVLERGLYWIIPKSAIIYAPDFPSHVNCDIVKPTSIPVLQPVTISILTPINDKRGSVPCSWGKQEAVISILRTQNHFLGVSRYNRFLIEWGRGVMGFPNGGGIQFLQVQRASGKAVLFLV